MKPLLALLACLLPALSFAKESDQISVPETSSETLLCNDQYCFSDEFVKELSVSFRRINFDEALNGDTFSAGGETIHLWNIKAPEKDSIDYLASKMFLEILLSDGILTCKDLSSGQVGRIMHCFIDGLDVGSMIIQMGMAEQIDSEEGYYQYEESIAKEKGRGIWKASASEK